MGCPPVRGDNPRVLASGSSYIQVGKHGITILHHLRVSVDLAHHKIFRAKVGKGGIRYEILGIPHQDPTITNYLVSLGR